MNIRERIRNFGILVIRMFWPGKGSKGVERLGILILGIAAMIGVSQAGTIQRFLTDAQAASVSDLTKTTVAALNEKNAALTHTAAPEVSTEEGKLAGSTNIVDLIADSELIVRGTVKELSDGIQNGVPYTEVTIQVSEALRGQFGDEYTYRQFGLLKPRKMDNGKINLNVSPDGWAKYTVGEETLLFLYQEASITGLRTTVGLGQGKIDLKAGSAATQFGNIGLFENVEVDKNLPNDSDRRLLATKKGPVNKDSLLSFVKRAVNEKWVEGRKLRHAKK